MRPSWKHSLLLISLWVAPTVSGCSTEKDVIVAAGTDAGTAADASRPEGAPDIGPPEIGSPPGNTKPWDPATARALKANETGGLFGGNCAEYTVDVASKRYTRAGCGAAATPTMRTLTAAEYAQVDADMAKLQLHTGMNCGADKGFLTVEVERTDSTKTVYWDSFYACMGGGRLYVDNIDGVMATLRMLAN